MLPSALSCSQGDVEMQTDDLAKLPLPARLAAMEALWDSLSHDPLHNPSQTSPTSAREDLA